MVLLEIFFHPTKIRRNETVRRAVSRCRGLAVVVARSYHVVLRPVCVRVWPRKSCVATGGGGVDSRSRFPNPRIMVCPPPRPAHPAQGPPPPTGHRCPPPFVTHRSVFILIYICVVTAARERYGATKRASVCVCARARSCANGERRKIAAPVCHLRVVVALTVYIGNARRRRRLQRDFVSRVRLLSDRFSPPPDGNAILSLNIFSSRHRRRRLVLLLLLLLHTEQFSGGQAFYPRAIL